MHRACAAAPSRRGRFNGASSSRTRMHHLIAVGPDDEVGGFDGASSSRTRMLGPRMTPSSATWSFNGASSSRTRMPVTYWPLPTTVKRLQWGLVLADEDA